MEYAERRVPEESAGSLGNKPSDSVGFYVGRHVPNKSELVMSAP